MASRIAMVAAVAVFVAAGCSSSAPAAGSGGPAGGTSGSAPASTSDASPAAAGTDAPAAGGGSLTVEQLCSALTPEELGAILGTSVEIDPNETEWCGYDFEEGSATLMDPFVGGRTAEDFIEMAETFECTVERFDAHGGGVISSCGADAEEGRPTEAWFLIDGVGVQLSIDGDDVTQEQLLEAVAAAVE